MSAQSLFYLAFVFVITIHGIDAMRTLRNGVHKNNIYPHTRTLSDDRAATHKERDDIPRRMHDLKQQAEASTWKVYSHKKNYDKHASPPPRSAQRVSYIGPLELYVRGEAATPIPISSNALDKDITPALEPSSHDDIFDTDEDTSDLDNELDGFLELLWEQSEDKPLPGSSHFGHGGDMPLLDHNSDSEDESDGYDSEYEIDESHETSYFTNVNEEAQNTPQGIRKIQSRRMLKSPIAEQLEPKNPKNKYDQSRRQYFNPNENSDGEESLQIVPLLPSQENEDDDADFIFQDPADMKKTEKNKKK